ncbi:MAG: AAA family ATPase [Thaumarchaeota archaeon]|nr:AAA family ATPase [Nitrososphaerota archaeon]
MARVKSGLLELDEMLGGGFMGGDSVMIAGSAGTGKTTLALQHLVNGVTMFGDNGIYVTFEQLPDQIYRDAKNFGWNLRKMEDENTLRLVCTSPQLLLESDGGESLLDEYIREIHPRRIVIDSLSHLAMYVDEKELRKETYRLVMHLKTRGLSSLLLWESPQIVGQSFSVTEEGLSFLVDCIILLKLVEIESSMKKALTVLKMRGSEHDKRLREFEITQQGIKVASPFSDYDGIITGSPRKRVTIEEAVGRFSEAFTAKRKKS